MSRIFPDLTLQEEEAIRAESRDRCRDDLHYLSKHVLGYDKITDHYHRQMAYDIDTPRYRFKLLLHPRGHYKSTLGTESRTVQKILRNPVERILITNAKLDNSKKFLSAVARHFKSNSLFRWVWRDWWIDTYATAYDRAMMKEKLDWVTRDTTEEFTVLRPSGVREATVTTGAVDASLVSQHYSTIIADDLINREYVRSLDMVEKSILYFKDLLDLLDPDGDLEIIGTRWAHHDLYGWIIEEFGGIASIRVPDNYTSISEETKRRAQETPDHAKRWMISIQPCFTEDGEPVFPEEFTHEVLQGLLDAKGPYEFGAQYLLDPTPREHQKFHEDWMIRLDVMPDLNTLTGCITVDPANSLADQADYSALVVCGYDDCNRMYLIDGFEERLTEDELLEAAFSYAKNYYRRFRMLLPVGWEAVSFQQVYISNLERMMLERNFFFPLYTPEGSTRPGIRRRQQSKEERIMRLVPRIKNGFYIPRKLMKESISGRYPAYDLVQRLKWQLTRFPYAGRDDLADALADQLEIVRSVRPRGGALPQDPQRPREFTHRSILEDQGLRPRRRFVEYDDAVR